MALKVEFFQKDYLENDKYIYAVIATRFENKWIFVRHKDRSTWEFPGGRREAGENILDAARRELQEETGATEYKITPLHTYSVTRGSERSFGLLCFAQVEAFDNKLTYEIEEIKGFDGLPKLMTYPEIIPALFEKVQSTI
jgi:8-oxo-dGTP diphosphatase